MLYLHLCNKPRFIYVEKHSKRVSQLPLCVLIIKCLFRLLPKTTHVCNKKREICMLEKRCICITLKVNLSINPSMVGFYHPLFLFLTILTTYGNTEQWTCKPVCSVRTQHTYHWPPRRGRSMVWVKLSSIGDSFKLQAIRVLENARMWQTHLWQRQEISSFQPVVHSPCNIHPSTSGWQGESICTIKEFFDSQATIAFDSFWWLSTIGPTMEWLYTIVEV